MVVQIKIGLIFFSHKPAVKLVLWAFEIKLSFRPDQEDIWNNLFISDVRTLCKIQVQNTNHFAEFKKKIMSQYDPALQI